MRGGWGGGTGSALNGYREASAIFLKVCHFLNSISLNKNMTSQLNPSCVCLLLCSGTDRIPTIVPQRIHESQPLSPHRWLSSTLVHVKSS